MKHLALFAITAALTALTARPPVLGQQKQNGQEREAVEPIVTEESLPNERGEHDFRWNLAYGRNGRRGAGALPGFEFFFGVSERIGAEISVPVVCKSEERTHYGLGDVSATVKALLVKQGTRAPAFVAGVEAGFPTGNPTIGTGDGAYEVAPFIALLKDLGPFTVQGNVGWSRKFAGSPATPRGEYFYNSAFDTPVHGKKLFLFAEINGTWGNGSHENKLSLPPVSGI